MLQLNNLLFAVAIVIGIYMWYRTGFRTPNAIRVSPNMLKRIIVVCGWAIVASIAIKSVGEIVGDGRVQIAKSGQIYAYRNREPVLFWGEIVGELSVLGGIGVLLVVLGRRSTLRNANSRGA